MIPGFITLYKKKDLNKNEDLVCLYFYKGYTDDNKPYYNDLDLSDCIYEYKKNQLHDGAVEYIFYNKKIKSMTCNLVKYNNEVNVFKLDI